MVTVILKRSAEPTVIQLTQENIMRELQGINGSEMLLEDTWVAGLRKVRTPLVCLVEADCTLSGGYLASNVSLLSKHVKKGGKGGGYNKLAMIASCLGIRQFDNRIYNYELESTLVFNDPKYDLQVKSYQLRPNRNKLSTAPYHVQVGFVPGAIIRTSSLGRDIDKLPWDEPDLIKMSTAVSFHFWETGRRLQVNPNTTYVSNQSYLDDPPQFDPKVPPTAANIFARDFVLAHNLRYMK